MKKLPRSFYMRDALAVATDLLGKVLVHETPGGIASGKIVEVEAYMGAIDPASHSYGAKRTERTKIQYGEGGFAYVYFIYGMYYCMNVVVNERETPEAILIRALEPVEGIDLMKQRRKTDSIKNLTNGPGKLCTALGIDRNSYGQDLCGNTLYLVEGEKDIEVEATKRINIEYAGEAKEYLWRFLEKNNPHVSVKVVK